MTLLTVLFAAIMSACTGSFATVLIHRVPAQQSLISPPSRCPSCGTTLRSWWNIPVVGWVALRGKARCCTVPIPSFYVFVELVSMTAGGLAAWWAVGHAATARVTIPGWNVDPVLILLLASIPVGVALTVIDWTTLRLPDPLTAAWTATSVVVVVAVTVASGHGAQALWPAAAGGLLWLAMIGGPWFLGALLGRPLMGFGDVKLAPVLGIITGWVGFSAAVAGLFAAFVVGAVLGVTWKLVIDRQRQVIPFGPFLIIGAAIGVAAGEPVTAWYLNLLT